MKFNALVKTHFFPILQKHGFEIAEEFKNILKFQSSVMKINVVFNEYDNSPLVEIGKRGETLFPLNDNSIKELFNSSLTVEKVTPDFFVKNLSTLFETKEGAEILKGNVTSFIKFKLLEINNYNTELMRNQTLEAASKAWEANEYVSFIKHIEEIGISNTPKAYQLKYKIAKQKL